MIRPSHSRPVKRTRIAELLLLLMASVYRQMWRLKWQGCTMEALLHWMLNNQMALCKAILQLARNTDLFSKCLPGRLWYEIVQVQHPLLMKRWAYPHSFELFEVWLKTVSKNNTLTWLCLCLSYQQGKQNQIQTLLWSALSQVSWQGWIRFLWSCLIIHFYLN